MPNLKLRLMEECTALGLPVTTGMTVRQLKVMMRNVDVPSAELNRIAQECQGTAARGRGRPAVKRLGNAAPRRVNPAPANRTAKQPAKKSKGGRAAVRKKQSAQRTAQASAQARSSAVEASDQEASSSGAAATLAAESSNEDIISAINALQKAVMGKPKPPQPAADELDYEDEEEAAVVSDDEDHPLLLDDEDEVYEQRLPSECLNYHIDERVERDVLAEKMVPIFKLMRGYRPTGQNVSLSSGRLVASDDTFDRRLAKQCLPIEQLVFGLKRYAEIVAAFPERVADIERHINNVLDISIRYGGRAFFHYHTYVWERFFRSGLKVWGENWVTLCPTALSAAVNREGSQAAHCNHCASWDHSSRGCPFQVRDTGIQVIPTPLPTTPNPTRQPKVRGDVSVPNRPVGTCRLFNTRARGCDYPACKFIHECDVCRSTEHGKVMHGDASKPDPAKAAERTEFATNY